MVDDDWLLRFDASRRAQRAIKRQSGISDTRYVGGYWRKVQRKAECIFYNPPNVKLSKDPSLPPLSVVVADSWPGP